MQALHGHTPGSVKNKLDYEGHRSSWFTEASGEGQSLEVCGSPCLEVGSYLRVRMRATMVGRSTIICVQG